jgi:chemotaxis regulatin CheY-phosphate phosphatase CheZ
MPMTRKKTAKRVQRRRSRPAASKTTQVFALDTTSPKYAEALEALLVGFAHGDEKVVRGALKVLGSGQRFRRLNTKANTLLQNFHGSIWTLRKDFDPSSVSMTTTNLPEASRTLDRVLQTANQTVQQMFNLIEQQEHLLSRGEQLMLQLEQQLTSGSVDSTSLQAALAECKLLTNRARQISGEMVISQEFEDICGQVIQKVRELIQGLERDISKLLCQLHVGVPDGAAAADRAERARLTEQTDVDSLLKTYGV